MKVLILSDIHGNQTALQEVLAYTDHSCSVDVCILTGDVIDYGMHSNEVVEVLGQMPYPVICNIRGNHEQAILTEDYTRFSSDRGRQCARYTRGILSDQAWEYIQDTMSDSGKAEFLLGDKRCLAVHGSLEDIYWKSIHPGQNLKAYREYDYVFSGHSHLPHFMEVFYEADVPERRNRKKTIFINPGSVGQPRNLNPMAQFAVLDTETEDIFMKKVCYDIKKEQQGYNGQVDDFYRKRLETGI